jgi:hypothetical protein
MSTHNRWVADTAFSDASGISVRVCTVFLGVDVGFGVGRPVLFETMILGGTCDRALYRYRSWREANAGHAAVVGNLKGPSDDFGYNLAIRKARDLARRTIKVSERDAIKYAVEWTARQSMQ